MIQISSFPLRSGGYLYYDRDAMRWIRSGKVGERGFAKRHEDHEKNAKKANHNNSNFYHNYPSKEILDQIHFRGRLGFFESLEQLIAAGFDHNSEDALLLDKCYQNGGFMIMNELDKDRIKSSMKHVPRNLTKFHEYLSYLIELGYDLAINTRDNVSSNPGFESFVGIFGSS